MNRFIKSLFFPLISIFIVFLIYFGLSLIKVNKDFDRVLAKNNQLSSELDQLSTNLELLDSNLEEAQQSLENIKNEKTTITSKVIPGEARPATVPVEKQNAEPTIVTKTLVQKIEKEVEKNQATVTIQNVGSFKVILQPNDTAFSILKRASEENSFPITYDSYGFGVFITSIGGIKPENNQYWAFYHNGLFSNVGASDQPIQKADSTFWQLQTF
jgi:F0F1-type ATP synthase membrane subunit b/b'